MKPDRTSTSHESDRNRRRPAVTDMSSDGGAAYAQSQGDVRKPNETTGDLGKAPYQLPPLMTGTPNLSGSYVPDQAFYSMAAFAPQSRTNAEQRPQNQSHSPQRSRVTYDAQAGHPSHTRPHSLRSPTTTWPPSQPAIPWSIGDSGAQTLQPVEFRSHPSAMLPMSPMPVDPSIPGPSLLPLAPTSPTATAYPFPGQPRSDFDSALPMPSSSARGPSQSTISEFIPPHPPHDQPMEATRMWAAFQDSGDPPDHSSLSPTSWHERTVSALPVAVPSFNHATHQQDFDAGASQPRPGAQHGTSSSPFEGGYDAMGVWYSPRQSRHGVGSATDAELSSFGAEYARPFITEPEEFPGSGSKSTPSRRRRGKLESSSVPLELEDEGVMDPDDLVTSRQNKRRQQNKLAQRAFRARTKLQNADTNSQIAHLIEINESQSRRLEEMTQLIAKLQKENLELKMAVINGRLPPEQQIGVLGSAGSTSSEVAKPEASEK